jgi:hypothetical protein
MTAKKPTMWRMTMTVSMTGSWREKNVLKTRQIARIAQISIVACHALGM